MAKDATVVIVVVGIGADGMAGLAPAARAELRRASVVHGSVRQLALLDGTVTATRRQWPSPMLPALRALDDGVHVLASGDPLLHGVGTTLMRMFGPERVSVLPHVSSVTLACARLGWGTADIEVISLVTANPHTAVRRGGRSVVLSRDGGTPVLLARQLTDAGLGNSRLTVFEQLGGAAERRRDLSAREWADHPPSDVDGLNVVAVRYLPDDRTWLAPDSAFEHDGQITKHGIRAVTLAALAPRPGELLWDVGAGSGSIAIAWSLAQAGCVAVAFERDRHRCARIHRNAATFGARVDVRGAAPSSFDGAPDPVAVFVGGGVREPGLLDACLDRLPRGGRLVANVVTVESEAAVGQRYALLGGVLRRFQHYEADTLGAFTGWRPARPITQWAVTKP